MTTQPCLNCSKPVPQRFPKRKKFCDRACLLELLHSPEQVALRFWAKVKKGDGCWTWQGARSSVTKYGMVSYLGHNIHAHRAAWLITNGPIESTKIHVLHRCYNGHLGCVNPAHLYLGSAKDNGADTRKSGRTTWGDRAGNALLTNEQAAEIRAAYTGKRGEQQVLADKYGVTSATVCQIVRGITYRPR